MNTLKQAEYFAPRTASGFAKGVKNLLGDSNAANIIKSSLVDSAVGQLASIAEVSGSMSGTSADATVGDDLGDVTSVASDLTAGSSLDTGYSGDSWSSWDSWDSWDSSSSDSSDDSWSDDWW